MTHQDHLLPGYIDAVYASKRPTQSLILRDLVNQTLSVLTDTPSIKKATYDLASREIFECPPCFELMLNSTPSFYNTFQCMSHCIKYNTYRCLHRESFVELVNRYKGSDLPSFLGLLNLGRRIVFPSLFSLSEIFSTYNLTSGMPN